MPRRKGGRRRKLNAPRAPSGRLTTPTHRVRAEDARRPVVERRMAHHGLTREQAEGQHGGTASGRLLLAGIIDATEFEALVRYGLLRHAYMRSLAGPAEASQALDGTPKGADNADTSERDRITDAMWQEAARALSLAHPLAHKAVADVASREHEPSAMSDPLRCGLDALVSLWGLAPGARAVAKQR